MGGIACFGHDPVLMGFDNEQRCDENNDYGDASHDDYGQKTGVAFAFFRSGVTLGWPWITHGLLDADKRV